MPEIIASWCWRAIASRLLGRKTLVQRMSKGRISQIIGHSKWFHRDLLLFFAIRNELMQLEKNACWRLRRRNCQPLDFKKGDSGSAKKAVFDKNGEFATQVVALDSQDLREAAPPASSMSSMLSAALARRPLAVETWLHEVE